MTTRVSPLEPSEDLVSLLTLWTVEAIEKGVNEVGKFDAGERLDL